MVDDLVDAVADVASREDDRTALTHALGIARHDLEARADVGREVGLVDDQQIALRDTGAAFARDLVAAGDVDDVDREVDELAAVLRREVVSAALDEEQLGRARDASAPRARRGSGVMSSRMAAWGQPPVSTARICAVREGLVPVEELRVLPGEDVVRHHAEPHPLP